MYYDSLYIHRVGSLLENSDTFLFFLHTSQIDGTSLQTLVSLSALLPKIGDWQWASRKDPGRRA